MIPMKGFEDLQRLQQSQLDSSMKLLSEWTRGWQAVAVEMTDYAKRSFETSTAHVQRLMAAKSLEQAVELQSAFAKRAYDEYMQEMTKMNAIFGDIARDAMKPVERAMRGGA
jgi:hypothetical protein